MVPGTTVYASRGGNTMTRGIKEKLEEHGFTVNVGNLKNESSIDVDKFTVPKNTRYVVRVSEQTETFMPYWCIFNGVCCRRHAEVILPFRDHPFLLSHVFFAC